MSQITLQAEPRTPGQTASKILRRNDRVPGVYYANGQDPIHFSVQKLALRPVVYTAEAKTVRLEVGGKGLVCILKDVTFHPVTDKILHFDLLGVAAGQKIAVEIPLHIVGQSIGVRDGGSLDQVIHKAHVMVDPTTMPEHIDVDVTDLAKGSSIVIGDLNIPGVEFVGRQDAVIVACHAPKVVAEEPGDAEKK